MGTISTALTIIIAIISNTAYAVDSQTKSAADRLLPSKASSARLKNSENVPVVPWESAKNTDDRFKTVIMNVTGNNEPDLIYYSGSKQEMYISPTHQSLDGNGSRAIKMNYLGVPLAVVDLDKDGTREILFQTGDKGVSGNGKLDVYKVVGSNRENFHLEKVPTNISLPNQKVEWSAIDLQDGKGNMALLTSEMGGKVRIHNIDKNFNITSTTEIDGCADAITPVTGNVGGNANFAFTCKDHSSHEGKVMQFEKSNSGYEFKGSASMGKGSVEFFHQAKGFVPIGKDKATFLGNHTSYSDEKGNIHNTIAVIELTPNGPKIKNSGKAFDVNYSGRTMGVMYPNKEGGISGELYTSLEVKDKKALKTTRLEVDKKGTVFAVKEVITSVPGKDVPYPISVDAAYSNSSKKLVKSFGLFDLNGSKDNKTEMIAVSNAAIPDTAPLEGKIGSTLKGKQTKNGESFPEILRQANEYTPNKADDVKLGKLFPENISYAKSQTPQEAVETGKYICSKTPSIKCLSEENKIGLKNNLLRMVDSILRNNPSDDIEAAALFFRKKVQNDEIPLMEWKNNISGGPTAAVFQANNSGDGKASLGFAVAKDFFYGKENQLFLEGVLIQEMVHFHDHSFMPEPQRFFHSNFEWRGHRAMVEYWKKDTRTELKNHPRIKLAIDARLSDDNKAAWMKYLNRAELVDYKTGDHLARLENLVLPNLSPTRTVDVPFINELKRVINNTHKKAQDVLNKSRQMKEDDFHEVEQELSTVTDEIPTIIGKFLASRQGMNEGDAFNKRPYLDKELKSLKKDFDQLEADKQSLMRDQNFMSNSDQGRMSVTNTQEDPSYGVQQ